MTKERFIKLLHICECAEEKYGKDYLNSRYGSRMSRMMDLTSADDEFHLRLDEFLEANDGDFAHDIFGIWEHSDRSTYPCRFDLFVPRFASYD